MGLGAGGGGTGVQKDTIIAELKEGIVLTNVVVKQREVIVDIFKPVYKEVVYEKPIVKVVEEETIRYKVKEEQTVKYTVVDKDTIQYVPKVVECEKPVIITKEYEKPIIKEQIYEKPIIEQKRLEVITIDNLNVIKDFIVLVKELNEELPKLKQKLMDIKDYKLVEKVISVPKLEYITTQVERIEWIPVKKRKTRKVER